MTQRVFEVSACVAAVEAIEADLLRLTDSMTENQFHAQPQTGGWSVAFCRLCNAFSPSLTQSASSTSWASASCFLSKKGARS